MMLAATLTSRLSRAVVLLLLPSVASAHTALRRSDPPNGARLSAAPTRVTLWFTERPQLAFSTLHLFGPQGEVTLGALGAVPGDGLRADVRGTLAPGAYRLEWRTASADGHPVSGSVAFTVLPVAAPGLPAAVTPAPPPSHTPPPEAHRAHSEYHVDRWFEFSALLTVLGVLGFRHGVLPPLAARGVPTADSSDRARRLGLLVAIVYALAALARLYNESVAIHGGANALDPSLLRPMITATVWGTGWLFGLVGAALLTLGWVVSSRSVTLGTPLALTGALGMVLSPALSGHAVSGRHFVVSIVLDVLHVGAAGVWLGGLLVLLLAGIPVMRRVAGSNPDAAVAALVNSFHPLALLCAPVVVAAGAATAWIRLGAISAVWSTDYGRVLIAKLGIVLLVAGMGLYNSMRARRRLGVAAGTRRLRRTASAEVALAAVVIALTTVLVTLPVPSEAVR